MMYVLYTVSWLQWYLSACLQSGIQKETETIFNYKLLKSPRFEVKVFHLN